LGKLSTADRASSLVVFETCEISGWVYDLVEPMGFVIAVANPPPRRGGGPGGDSRCCQRRLHQQVGELRVEAKLFGQCKGGFAHRRLLQAERG